MRQGKTHWRMTKGLFPNIPGKVVRDVNRMVDNPNRQQRALAGALGMSPFQGLNPYGHRAFGHDPLTAMQVMAKHGPQGLMAYFAHIAEDYANDQFVRRYGADMRDMLEGAYNIGYKNRRR